MGILDSEQTFQSLVILKSAKNCWHYLLQKNSGPDRPFYNRRDQERRTTDFEAPKLWKGLSGRVISDGPSINEFYAVQKRRSTDLKDEKLCNVPSGFM